MRQQHQAGQALIISILFLVVVLVLVSSLMEFVGLNVRGTRSAVAKEQALQLAEAGIDKAVWQLNQTVGTYVGETDTALSTGVFDVSVATLSSVLKDITATGYIPNKTSPIATKQVKVHATIETTGASFFYGIQVGAGGLIMGNNSTVTGNVYSNGLIDGDSGAIITEDAFSAGPSGRIFDRLRVEGNAHANRIDTDVTVGGNAYGQTINQVTVTGNVYTNSMSNCSVGGDAFYTTSVSCTVAGTSNTPYLGAADPPMETMPLSDEEIADWKSQAEDGGTIFGDYTLTNGAQGSLGPKKITGNLLVDNNATLTITGKIWVQGNVTFSNNAIIALHPSYGDLSEAIIADGLADVVNNVIFQRAGPASYILMLTTSSDLNAFDINNNADTLIVYAANGGVNIANNANLREVTGWRVNLSNNASIMYETGLASLLFSSGPGASWTILRGTWRE